LTIAQLEEQPAFRFPRHHGKRPVERTARGDHAQVRVEHQKGLAYGVDNRLSQTVAMRDGGERIVLGHTREPRSAL
jgi:hypothetical protein